MEKSKLRQILWEPSVHFTLSPVSQVPSEGHKQQKIICFLARMQAKPTLKSQLPNNFVLTHPQSQHKEKHALFNHTDFFPRMNIIVTI